MLFSPLVICDFLLKIEEYLKATGEKDEYGEQMSDYIQKDDGRKHSKWPSFMYPRLIIAREMLRDDGVIFISIDDNEVHHLRLLMNELFGEGEFVASFIWRKKRGGGRGNSIVIPQTEYILCYSKNIQEIKPFQKEKH